MTRIITSTAARAIAATVTAAIDGRCAVTQPPSREPGQADAGLEADITVFLTEMERWNNPPRTAALTVRIIADRTRDKERIVALEEALEHWGGDNKHMGISTVDPVTCPSCVKARALLEVQDGE